MGQIPLPNSNRRGCLTPVRALMTSATLVALLAAGVAGAQTVTVLATDPIAAEVGNPDGTTNTGTFQITRSGNLNTSLTVSVILAGTGIYGVDYVTVPALGPNQDGPQVVRFTISQGQSSGNILVIPRDDNLAETNETVILTILTNSSYSVGQPAAATITILEDNDTNRPPSVWLTLPPPDARFVTGNNILLGANVFDPDANAQTVEFFLDGTSAGVVKVGSITNLGAYQRTNFAQFAGLLAPELAPGSHLLTARATDLFGAQATAASQTFTVLPAAVSAVSPALAAEPNSQSSYALDAHGGLYMWGQFPPGLLGTNNYGAQAVPLQVPVPAGATAWYQVAGGQDHSLAIANNGQLYSWGDNCCGQLGIGPLPAQLAPVPVRAPAAVSGWRKAAAGALYSVAIDNTGRLYAWGNNWVGQLGIGSTFYPYEPVPVPFPAGVSNWVDVAAGSEHTLVLAASGMLYACGVNTQGELGNNTISNDVPYGVSHLIPAHFPSGVTGWTQIAAGAFHSLALGNDGNLYSWGYNLGGEVLPTSSARIFPNPVLVPPGTAPWTAVSGGSYSTLGLARDGSLFQWGYGQPRTMTNGPPIAVPPGASRWLSIAAAAVHSLAIADDCKVYAWGFNSYGELGDGSTSISLVPVPALLPADFCSAPTIVPVVRVFPRFQLSSGDTSFTIISANYSNAIVILDASLSTNSAGALMRFAWFEDGATNASATNVVVKDLLSLGNHLVELEVFARGGVAATNVRIQIITTGEAVAELKQRIYQAALGPQLTMLLTNPLDSAQRAFDNGQPGVGLVHLRVFQDRLSDHLAPSAPDLAADFLHVAQEIIDTVQPAASHPPGPLAVQTAGPRRSRHLTFIGSPGQTYLVEASANLGDWQLIGVASQSAPGSFQLDDPAAGAFPNRFYRIVLPW